MRKARVNVSAESSKGASLFMEKSGKRHPYDSHRTSMNDIPQDLTAGSRTSKKGIEEPLLDHHMAPPVNQICPMPINRVDQNLYIGDSKGASEYEILKNNGITHIINTAQEIPNFFPGEFEYIKVDLLDDPSKKEDLSKILEPVYQYITSILNKNPNAKIFIHCHAGKSRSATISIYYLMRKHSWGFQRALQYLQKIRWIVQPNEWYMHILQNI